MADTVLRTMGSHARVARRVLGVGGGVAVLAVGVFTLAAVSAPGFGPAAFADSFPYELYCPNTPVGNVVLNDVVTSGALSPLNPVSGEQFQLTNYQTTLAIPSSIASAAAALGNSDLSGTVTSQIDASGASPSSVPAGTATFDVPIPSPVPDQGVVIDSPGPPVTLGPFMASGADITVSQDKRTTLTLEVSGSSLNLHCTSYKNRSLPTGLVVRRPYTTPIYPVIAFSTTPLEVTTTLLPAGHVGGRYSTGLAATGGNPPYLWRLATGSAGLPRGLKLNRHSGLISGTPSAGDAGTATFTVEVLDTKMRGKPPTRNTITKVFAITVT